MALVRLVRAAAALAGLAVVAGAASACVDVDGGSVEVPWALFAPDGRAINDCACTSPALSSVRLVLEAMDSGARPCDGRAECRFSCGRQIGATPFDIPPGSYFMSVVPLDRADQALPFEVPPPILRVVRNGQPTELEAFAIKAPCAGERPAEEGPNCGGASGDRACSAD